MTSIEWLDHTADVAFRARGASIEDVFCEAARAVFSLMFEVDAPGRCGIEQRITASAASLHELLVEWLSELLVHRELLRAAFTRFEATVCGDDASGFRVEGLAFGDSLACTPHRLGMEVKGIPPLGLRVVKDAEGWSAQVVVDV